MVSKTKAFIGMTVSFAVLIVLFASNGGFRAARAAEEEAAKTMDKNCSVAEKVVVTETMTQTDAK